MENKLDIGKRMGRVIRVIRLSKGWSQEELSFQSGLHRTYIGAVERGEKNLTVKNLVRIAVSLGVTAGELLSQAQL